MCVKKQYTGMAVHTACNRVPNTTMPHLQHCLEQACADVLLGFGALLQAFIRIKRVVQLKKRKCGLEQRGGAVSSGMHRSKQRRDQCEGDQQTKP